MSDDRKQQRQEENNTTSSFKSTISSPSVTGVPKLDVSSQVAIAKQSVNLVSQHAIDLAVEQRPLLISGLELNKSAGKVTVGENCVNVNGWSRVSDVEQSLTGKDNNIANVVFTHDGHLVHYIKSENGVQGEQVLDNHSSYRLIMHQPTWQHSDPVDLGKDTPKESGRSVNMHTEAAAPWCPKLWYVNPSVSHENNLVQTPDTQHWNSIDHQSSTSSELPSKKLHLDSPVSFGDLPKTHGQWRT
ncbi:hypothetical protein SK128_013887 [Halocaridina rubra]|uniref:Uncharacterized protein n=1 Tax=Halocaridina rubra TaxID=373956 RepID=A0AAN8XIG7_HALRR